MKSTSGPILLAQGETNEQCFYFDQPYIIAKNQIIYNHEYFYLEQEFKIRELKLHVAIFFIFIIGLLAGTSMFTCASSHPSTEWMKDGRQVKSIIFSLK